MCWPIAIAAAAVAVQAIGSYTQGRAAQRQAAQEAAGLDYRATMTEDNARADAAMIRKEGAQAVGQTRAVISASGVKVDQGSALDAQRQVMADYAHDEQMAILNGTREARSLRMSGANIRSAGSAAARAASINTAGSLLSRGAGMWASGGAKAGG